MKKNLKILLLITSLPLHLLQAIDGKSKSTMESKSAAEISAPPTAQPKSVKELRAFYEKGPEKTTKSSSQEVRKLTEAQLSPFTHISEKAKTLEKAGNFEALKLLMDVEDIVDNPEEFKRLEEYVETIKAEREQEQEQMRTRTRGGKQRGTISPELYQKPEGEAAEMPSMPSGTSEFKTEAPEIEEAQKPAWMIK